MPFQFSNASPFHIVGRSFGMEIAMALKGALIEYDVTKAKRAK